MKLRPYSSAMSALCGFILMGMGFFFVFLRPPLLPEDIRYLDTSLPTLQSRFPHLLLWLHRVFWVMGAFIFTSGVLTLSIALTSFLKRAPAVAGLMALTEITSIGWMTVVKGPCINNFPKFGGKHWSTDQEVVYAWPQLPH